MEKEAFLKNLGSRIIELRTKKGLSQAELASLIGKDQQSLGRVERAEINPSIYYLQEVATGLGVHITKLLDW
jgi:putative transcriptional regulator